MTTHPYLRAYLAGVFIPTLMLPVILTGFVIARLVIGVPFPIERIVVFPIALVPVGWGLWNVLWLASRGATHLSLGPHGAILPALLVPSGALLAHGLGIAVFGAASFTAFNAVTVPYVLIAVGFCFAVAVYYLVWKYIVGFVNRLLGIA